MGATTVAERWAFGNLGFDASAFREVVSQLKGNAAFIISLPSSVGDLFAVSLAIRLTRGEITIASDCTSVSRKAEFFCSLFA